MKKFLISLALSLGLAAIVTPALQAQPVITTYWNGLRWDTGPTAPTVCYEPGWYYQTSGTAQLMFCDVKAAGFVAVPKSVSGTFTTPNLGTPSAINLANATNLPAGALPTAILVNAAPVTLTAAQVNGMYTTPVQIIAAQGAGTIIVLNSCTLDAIFGSAAFTGGGVIGMFYGAVSPPVSIAGSTINVSFLTTFAANQVTTIRGGAVAGGTLSSIAVNAPVYISNQTQVFAVGTGATLSVTCQYYVVSGVQ